MASPVSKFCIHPIIIIIRLCVWLNSYTVIASHAWGPGFGSRTRPYIPSGWANWGADSARRLTAVEDWLVIELRSVHLVARMKVAGNAVWSKKHAWDWRFEVVRMWQKCHKIPRLRFVWLWLRTTVRLSCNNNWKFRVVPSSFGFHSLTFTLNFICDLSSLGQSFIRWSDLGQSVSFIRTTFFLWFDRGPLTFYFRNSSLFSTKAKLYAIQLFCWFPVEWNCQYCWSHGVFYSVLSI